MERIFFEGNKSDSVNEFEDATGFSEDELLYLLENNIYPSKHEIEKLITNIHPLKQMIEYELEYPHDDWLKKNPKVQFATIHFINTANQVSEFNVRIRARNYWKLSNQLLLNEIWAGFYKEVKCKLLPFTDLKNYIPFIDGKIVIGSEIQKYGLKDKLCYITENYSFTMPVTKIIDEARRIHESRPYLEELTYDYNKEKHIIDFSFRSEKSYGHSRYEVTIFTGNINLYNLNVVLIEGGKFNNDFK